MVSRRGFLALSGIGLSATALDVAAPTTSPGARRGRRRLATVVSAALVAAFGGLVVTTGPAYAATESELCRQKAGGTLAMNDGAVTWGQATSASWTVKLIDDCADAGPTLSIVDDAGTVLYQAPDPFAGSGTAPVTPTRVGGLHLRLSTFGGARELAATGVSVVEPGPLTTGETSVRITGSDLAQRVRLVQAMRTDNMTVTVAGTLDEDLSGLDGIHLGRNVHVVGDRSVVATGPRLFTTTDPRAFLVVDQDGVRLTGLRVDGQESLDPFANVGLPDTDGIQVNAAVHVEIDHDEIFRWRGAGVDVRDGNDDDRADYVGRLNRDNVEDNGNNVWVHDNYLHHNQHPSAENCVEGSGHAGGYGVEAADGGYVKIERNAFDWNRHSIAGDGKHGTGYVARDNLVLQNGGVHFKCVDPDSSLWVFVADPFIGLAYVVKQMLDPDHIYHTHAIDMHGTSSDCGVLSGDHNCGPAGEYMDISYNTILYTQGSAIHLRGTPAVGMFVRDNVFAHSEHDGSLLTPGAMVQNELGLYDQGNTLGLNTFNDRRSCDFDGDGTADPMIATGVAWWYASSALGGRWVFLNRSPKRLADLVLRDVDGDGRCDVSDGTNVFLGTGDGALQSYNLNGSPIAAARNGTNRLEVFGTNSADAVVYRAQSTPGGALNSWGVFDGALRSVAAETNTDGRVELFGVNAANQIFHRLQTSPGNWSGSGWQQFDGLLTAIAVARNADGRLEMFGRNAAGQVWHRAQTGPANWSGSSWQSFDGVLRQVAAETNADGRVELVGVSPAGSVWHRVQAAPGNWSGSAWQQFDGGLVSVAAARDADGRLEIFGADRLGHLLRRVQPAAGDWSGSAWQQFDGGPPVSQVAAETNGDGRIELYAVAPDGSVSHRAQVAAGDWSGSAWSAVDGTLRITRPVVPLTSPVVANPGSRSAVLNSSFTLAGSAGGGTAPYTWSATGLPAGLSVNAGTGQIAGAPAAAGTFTVTLSAVDSSNPVQGGSATFSLTVLVPVPNIVGYDRIGGAGALQNVGLLLGNERDVVVMLCDDRIGHITAQNTPAGTAVPVGSSISYDFGVKPSGNSHCQ